MENQTENPIVNQIQMVLKSNPGLTIAPLNNAYQPRNQVQTSHPKERTMENQTQNTIDNQIQMALISNPGLTITSLNNAYQPRNQVQTCKYCPTTFTDPMGMTQLLHYVTVHLNDYPEMAVGVGDAIVPQNLGRSVNPVSTRGADYAHHITTGSSGFPDLPTALNPNEIYDVSRKRNDLLIYLRFFLGITPQLRGLWMNDNPVFPTELEPYLRQFQVNNFIDSRSKSIKRG